VPTFGVGAGAATSWATRAVVENKRDDCLIAAERGRERQRTAAAVDMFVACESCVPVPEEARKRAQVRTSNAVLLLVLLQLGCRLFSVHPIGRYKYIYENFSKEMQGPRPHVYNI
jgi:hypothetical protein